MSDKTKDLVFVLAFLAVVAAWMTHTITGIMAQAWVFLILGTLMFPIAVAHGFSVWLGFNWLG